jgi:endogenous inhibitor of DNA gyrase (YacG/DUF329 family)
MVEELDYGYREELWLEYKRRANLEDLLEAFKRQWKNWSNEMDVITSASGAITMAVMGKTYFWSGPAQAAIVIEPLTDMVCAVTLYTRGSTSHSASPNRSATKLNGEITKFIKEECANLVRVIEGSALLALRIKLLETSSLLGSRSKESKEKRERSPSETQVVTGICPVCQSQIKPSETTVSCPYCHVEAHRVHLLEWIHVKGSCPSCRRTLRADEIKEPEPTINGEMR